jgi:site-specific DNA recombinase
MTDGGQLVSLAQNPPQSTDTSRRVAIYARTSSASQEYGYSIDEQVRQCLNRCEALEWEVTHIFRDEAVSGKNTDRPMFQQMLDVAEAGEFEVLMFWKLDRFSRSIMHAVQLEKRFRDLGIALHSVTEQLDTTTAAGKFNFRNIANAAEFERDLIKQRTQMGHTARAMNNKWPNKQPPLGYSKDNEGRLKPTAEEAALVRLIFSYYVSERSMRVVANRLNAQNRTTKRDNEWSAAAVGNIIRNEIYVGVFSIGKVEKRVKDYQIISKERFEKAQAVRKRFQSSEPASRGAMDSGSRTELINEMLQEYSDFISG